MCLLHHWLGILLKKSTVGRDAFLQTAPERHARARQMFGIYALKCALDSSDDRGSGVVAGPVDVLLKNAPQKVVQGVQIRRRRRPTVLIDEMGHGPPAEVLCSRARVGSAPSCWKT